MRERTARLSLYRGAVRAIEQRGGSTGQLLRAAGIRPGSFDVPDARVSISSAWRFLELASQTLNAPDFGFIAASALEFEDLGRLGRELCQTLTLFDGLCAFSRGFRNLLPLGEFAIEKHDEHAWFWYSYGRGVPPPPLGAQAQAEQFVLGVMIKVIQLAAGPGWLPREIRMQMQPICDFGHLPQFNGVETHWRQSVSAIAAPTSLLLAPVRDREQPSAEMRAEPPWLVELRTAVKEALPWNVLPIESAAESAAMSTRTLQRQMAVEGLTYSRFLDQIRFDLALRLLEGNADLSDIALDLGYSANTHFTRAFKRWTGVAPSAFRQGHLHQVAGAAIATRRHLPPRAATSSCDRRSACERPYHNERRLAS